MVSSVTNTVQTGSQVTGTLTSTFSYIGPPNHLRWRSWNLSKLHSFAEQRYSAPIDRLLASRIVFCHCPWRFGYRHFDCCSADHQPDRHNHQHQSDNASVRTGWHPGNIASANASSALSADGFHRAWVHCRLHYPPPAVAGDSRGVKFSETAFLLDLCRQTNQHCKLAKLNAAGSNPDNLEAGFHSQPTVSRW